MLRLVWYVFRLRRTRRLIEAILAGDWETLLRRRLIGRLVWLPLYRRLRRRRAQASHLA